MTVTIYTDGACSSNPGVGGWGVVILKQNESPIYLNGGMLLTTNNQMELTAAIKALQYFNKSTNLILKTDSKYLTQGVESWIIKWKKNGWKTSAKNTVKNKELWIELNKQIERHTIDWEWIKGHANYKYNEKADYLAKKFIKNNK